MEIEEKERSYYPLQLRQLFKGQFTKCLFSAHQRLKPSKAEEPNLPVTSFNCRSAVGSLGLPLSAPFGQRPHFTTSAKVSACPGSQRPGSYNTFPPDKTSSPASSLEATLRAKPPNVHVVGNIQKSKHISCESAIKYAGIDMRCNESHPSQFSKASGAFTITETVDKANFTIPTGHVKFTLHESIFPGLREKWMKCEGSKSTAIDCGCSTEPRLHLRFHHL